PTSAASLASAPGTSSTIRPGTPAGRVPSMATAPASRAVAAKACPAARPPSTPAKRGPRGPPARVNHDRPGHRGGRIGAAVQPGPGDPGDLVERERDHNSPLG